MTHRFILTPGIWEGAGQITFSMAEDILDFTMRWSVLPLEEEKVEFHQEIVVEGLADTMRNHFCVSSLTPSAFEIELENKIVGKVVGTGVISSQVIAWEFRRKDQEFEGYEIYELQEDDSYQMRAEFTAGDGLRTCVQGAIAPTRDK
ncbi:MAG: hypothetical protein S4CHLAM2_11620 [Chlamydiales bacterium]|nr:hypothetical protein [Chlamydiales bacterium]